jgi:hypothetical protein
MVDQLNAYCIQRLQHGGYVVSDFPSMPGMAFALLFACKDIEDALQFVHMKFIPPQVVLSGDKND